MQTEFLELLFAFCNAIRIAITVQTFQYFEYSCCIEFNFSNLVRPTDSVVNSMRDAVSSVLTQNCHP